MSNIDYARMQKVYPKQKAALTRAVKTKNLVKVIKTCEAAIKEWDEIGCWPDDWARWDRALGDVAGWSHPLSINGMNQLAQGL